MRRSKLRWGVAQRMKFIEFRLFWEGSLNRRDLMETFGVSTNQASGDFKRYSLLAPENILYSGSIRRYIRGDQFRPRFFRPDAERYLGQLGLGPEADSAPAGSWVGFRPGFGALPPVTRPIDPVTLRAVLGFMRRGQWARIRYLSYRWPEPVECQMYPHGIGHDGFSWRVRAYCAKCEGFRDFVLARITAVGSASASQQCRAADDRAWSVFAEVRIRPSPGLTDAERRAVELEFGMQDGVARFRVRGAFVPGMLERLGVARNPRSPGPGSRRVALMNPDELAEFL